MAKPKLTAVEMNLGDGLQTRLVDDLVKESQCRSVMNYEFSSYPGMATTRNGFVAWAHVTGAGTMRLLRKFYTESTAGADYFIAHRGTDLYRAMSNGTTFSLVLTGLANLVDDSECYDNGAYIVNGTDAIRSSDGATWFPMGNTPPTTPPTLAAIAGGSALGNYYAAYSYFYGPFGESPTTAITAAPVTVANQRIQFSNLSTGAAGVSRRRFYLSSHSAPGTVYRIGSDGGAGTTWSSPAFTEDDLLDAAEVGLTAFPKCDRICFHAGRMFGVPVTEKSTIVMSRAFQPDISDPLDDIHDVRDFDGARITRLISLSNEILIVLTETACWALYGSSPASWKLARIFEVGAPYGSFRSVVVINGRVYWKSRRHVYSTNGYREGTQCISLSIEGTLDTISLTDAAISYWCAVDYRPKNWLMIFVTPGNRTRGAETANFHADLLSGVGTAHWTTQDWSFDGRLCLVYDYLQSSPGREIWTLFNLNAAAATVLNGRNDTGLVYFSPEYGSTGAIRQFERPDGNYGDDSDLIPAKIRYAWKSEGDFARDKRWRRTWVQARMLGSSGVLYTGVSKDLGSSTWVDAVNLSTQATVQHVVLPTDMTNFHHSYYLGFTSGGARLLVESLSEEYKTKARL